MPVQWWRIGGRGSKQGVVYNIGRGWMGCCVAIYLLRIFIYEVLCVYIYMYIIYVLRVVSVFLGRRRRGWEHCIHSLYSCSFPNNIYATHQYIPGAQIRTFIDCMRNRLKLVVNRTSKIGYCHKPQTVCYPIVDYIAQFICGKGRVPQISTVIARCFNSSFL